MQKPASPLELGNANAALVRPEYTMARPVMHGSTSPRPTQNIAGQTMPRHNNMPNAQARQAMHSTTAHQSPPAGQDVTFPTRTATPQPSTHTADQPSSPEQAAQQFRRMNKSLPDGVRYEPLDEATMRLLRENGHLPPVAEPPATAPQVQQSMTQPPPMAQQTPMIQPQTPVAMPAPAQQMQQPMIPQTMMQQPPIAMQPTTSPETGFISKTIEGLIQDERNAQVFYSHLAKTMTGSQIAAATLADIADDNIKHTQKFSQILTSHFGGNFTPAEAEINTKLEFKDALALALEEENNTLRTLIELSEGVANTEPEKIIQRIINKKIANYNRLERLLALS